jgi:hypothetical protein
MHHSRALVRVAGALLLAAPALPQTAPFATPLAAALDRALSHVQAELARDVDLWEDHSTWENAWSVRTDHFHVRTTKSRGEADNLARGLEVMLGHFQRTLATDFAPAEPIPVWVFPDVTAYNTFGEQHGADHSSFYGAFFAPGHPERPVVAAPHENPLYVRMMVTHAVTHAWVAQAFPGATPPLWVDEGLAAYFAAYWHYDWAVSELERIRAGDSFVPLRQLLSGTIETYRDRTHERLTELAMLFYYLLRYREETRTTLPHEEPRAAFRDYLLAALRGRPLPDGPAKDVLADPAALDAALREFQFPR